MRARWLLMAVLVGSLTAGCHSMGNWKDDFQGHPELVNTLPKDVKVLERRCDQAEGVDAFELVEVRLQLPAGFDSMNWIATVATLCRSAGKKIESGPGRLDLFSPNVTVIVNGNQATLLRSQSR